MIAAALTALGMFAIYWWVEWYQSIPRMWVTVETKYGATSAYYLPFKMVGNTVIVKTYRDWEVVDGEHIKRLEGMIR